MNETPIPDDQEIDILKQLHDGVIRPAKNMARRLGLKPEQVEKALKELEAEKLVEKRREKWRIAYDGKLALHAYEVKEQQKLVKEQEKLVTAEENEVTNRFSWICWVLAGACAALGLVDFLWEDNNILNTSRLALVGAVIGLVVLPFAQKLKLLGVEFERARGTSIERNETQH